MEDCSAVKTVVLFTHRAVEFEVVFLVCFIKDKSELAIRSRAPRDIFLQFERIFKLELGKFAVIFVVKHILNVDFIYSLLAFLFRTNNWEL
jgi:hypothetical protein